MLIDRRKQIHRKKSNEVDLSRHKHIHTQIQYDISSCFCLSHITMLPFSVFLSFLAFVPSPSSFLFLSACVLSDIHLLLNNSRGPVLPSKDIDVIFRAEEDGTICRGYTIADTGTYTYTHRLTYIIHTCTHMHTRISLLSVLSVGVQMHSFLPHPLVPSFPHLFPFPLSL